MCMHCQMLSYPSKINWRLFFDTDYTKIDTPRYDMSHIICGISYFLKHAVWYVIHPNNQTVITLSIVTALLSLSTLMLESKQECWNEFCGKYSHNSVRHLSIFKSADNSQKNSVPRIFPRRICSITCELYV